MRCNILLEEKVELLSKLDLANKEVNLYKKLFNKTTELQVRKQHDTIKVCTVAISYCIVVVKQYRSLPYCILHLTVLQYIEIWTGFW